MSVNLNKPLQSLNLKIYVYFYYHLWENEKFLRDVLKIQRFNSTKVHVIRQSY